MVRVWTALASVVLFVHGLIHLMGTAAYLRLAEVEGLPYKTAVLGGRWELGEAGTRLFGAAWAVAGVGFTGLAIAWLAGRRLWRPALLGATLLSLALTLLGRGVAFGGAVANLAILAGLWGGAWAEPEPLGPRAPAGR